MNKIVVTITTRQIMALTRRVLCFALLFAGLPRLSATSYDSSFGFIFDRYALTLEEGDRAEAVGPLFYVQHETENGARTAAFVPFFSCYEDPSVESQETDFLYPLFTSVQYGQERRWQFLQLFSSAGGQQQNGTNQDRFTLFPIYFQQRSKETNQNYTAVFPVYGHLQNRFWRDRIFFVMFPIYSQTQKRDVVTDNYLFPIGSVSKGNGLHGWGVWPLAGHEHKIVTLETNGFGDVLTNGGHDRAFALWPLWIRQDNGIGTTNAEMFRASIPLFVCSHSPGVDMTTALWPLITKIDNREKKYWEWQVPWPLIIVARGEGKTTTRVFPLFQKSHSATLESDFYLWPVYTYRRTHSDPLDFRRTRVVFYLYADIEEKNTKTGAQKKRLDMWPFFTWRHDFDGNERLQVLAPLEPILPNNRGVERNWSPLWSLWRAEANPKTGASSHSLFWNLYRDEKAPAHKKVSLLFGLFQYQSDGENRRTKLFYITVAKSSAPKNQ
jgi:hypothetical protein